MDKLFARRPHIVSCQDDILTKESSDMEHLDNLDRVLKKLSTSGLWVRLNKYKFIAPSVTYLGHRIDSEGLHPTEDKIQAIRDTPAPHNVTELKAFLGLFPFYARYVSNIVDKLGPLYHLLQKGCPLEMGIRSFFSVSAGGGATTDESCPDPLRPQEGTYPYLWC